MRMKRKGRFSVSPKRILTSIKASTAGPVSPVKAVLRTDFSPFNPFFSTKAAQERHRALLKLYGHFDLEKELFPPERRDTITIPKVKVEYTEVKSPAKPLLLHQDCSPVGPLIYALTPKADGRTQRKVCCINLSEYVHTSERYEAVKAPPPKKVLTQGTKSHINRAEPRTEGHLLLSGKSAFQGSDPSQPYSTRLNRTVPNIQLSEAEENSSKEERVIKGSLRARRIKSASRTRSRGESGTKSRFDQDKVTISPPQVSVEGCSPDAASHDRTTSISIDFNLPVPAPKCSRVLQLNKVDLGDMLDVPSPKASEIPRKRPASAKFAAKRPFWRLDETIC